MPKKQDELLSYDYCCTTQASFLCFHGEFKDNRKCPCTAPFPAVGTWVRFFWVSFSVSPYQLHQTLQFSFSATLASKNATIVDTV